MEETLALTTCFDFIEDSNGDDQARVWIRRALDAKIALARFVADRRGRGSATEVVGFLKGSFNLGFRIRCDDDGPDAVIRLPKPGHITADLLEEKLINEVHAMEFIRQNTTIPVPFIHSWGLTSESPHQLGPFIIMDFVEGTMASRLIQKPTDDQQEIVLNPDVDSVVLDILSTDGRTISPRRALPGPAASDFFNHVAHKHLTHLQIQRNIAASPEVARARYIARHRYMQLVDHYCSIEDDAGPFIPFCDDLRPANILMDPETYDITAVLDWEFTNAMPAQFSYDPPWWLLLADPGSWVDRNEIQEFRDLYEPRMHQFLQALEAVESEDSLNDRGHQSSLSVRMRRSWETGRFWFNFASRKSYDVDTIFWSVLHKEGDAAELLQADASVAMEAAVEKKMEQLQEYREEYALRFPLEDAVERE